MGKREVSQAVLIRGEIPEWSVVNIDDGDGSGYGYGSGDGSGYYRARYESWRKTHSVPDVATIALWKSDESGRACNGGRSEKPVSIGLVEEIRGPLKICTRNGLHATNNPDSYQGSRIWIVALFGEVQWEGDKCASLKREIIGELI